MVTVKLVNKRRNVKKSGLTSVYLQYFSEPSEEYRLRNPPGGLECGETMFEKEKYRYSKIQNSEKAFQYLYNVDSLYLADLSMRPQVLKAEQRHREKLELFQKAQESENTSQRLRKESRKKKDYT